MCRPPLYAIRIYFNPLTRRSREEENSFSLFQPEKGVGVKNNSCEEREKNSTQKREATFTIYFVFSALHSSPLWTLPSEAISTSNIPHIIFKKREKSKNPESKEKLSHRKHESKSFHFLPVFPAGFLHCSAHSAGIEKI